MNFRFINLVKLNGVELTDESRAPLQEERDLRSVPIDLASGKIRKFIKGLRHKWTITWDNVGESASQTVDGKGGRNEVRAIAQIGDTMTFVIQDGRHTAETYTVFVDSYTDSVVMRRVDCNRYTCTISLVEQG